MTNKKYTLVHNGTINLPPNPGDFEQDVFTELKTISKKWKFGKLNIEEMIDDLHLDVVNYLTWDWKSKIVESIEVLRDLGYQSTFSDEFINTIKDLCLDLTDKDYEVYIHEYKYHRYPGEKDNNKDTIYKSISIEIDSVSIEVETLKNTLLSIKHFCEEYHDNFSVDVEICTFQRERLGLDKSFMFLSVDSFIKEFSDDDDFSELSIIIYQRSPQQ